MPGQSQRDLGFHDRYRMMAAAALEPEPHLARRRAIRLLVGQHSSARSAFPII